MKIAVIGASAGIGLEVVKQLVDSGKSVTTLSRTIESIPDSNQVTKIKGSALNEADILRTIAGADSVLVTLGTGMSTKATGLYPKASRELLRALANLPNKPPLIVLTGFGAGNSWDYNSFFMKWMFTLFLKEIYAEKSQMEQIISNNYPNAMFIRPGRLTHGALTRTYRVITNLDKSTKVGAISRKDVAHFMIEQSRNQTYIGNYPALSY